MTLKQFEVRYSRVSACSVVIVCNQYARLGRYVKTWSCSVPKMEELLGFVSVWFFSSLFPRLWKQNCCQSCRMFNYRPPVCRTEQGGKGLNLKNCF